MFAVGRQGMSFGHTLWYRPRYTLNDFRLVGRDPVPGHMRLRDNRARTAMLARNHRPHKDLGLAGIDQIALKTLGIESTAPLHRSVSEFDCAPTDIASAKTVAPVDLVDRLICAARRLPHRRAARSDAKHSPTWSHMIFLYDCVPAWNISHALDGSGLIETLDLAAIGNTPRISMRRHHHVKAASSRHLRSNFASAPSAVASSAASKSDFSRIIRSLTFRIAESHIVFDQLRPFVRDIIRPANKTPLNGVPRLAMPATVGRMISTMVRSIITGVMTGAGE